jgi:hypothetical protein
MPGYHLTVSDNPSSLHASLPYIIYSLKEKQTIIYNPRHYLSHTVSRDDRLAAIPSDSESGSTRF